MHLTLHADFSFRVLVYLAVHKGRLVSTLEMSQAYGISANHLVKVVLNLGKLGYIRSRRGRTGGNELAMLPADINLGQVLRQVEPDFKIVECFDHVRNTCPIKPDCRLKMILEEAVHAFLRVLDKHTLADMVHDDATGSLNSFFPNLETVNYY